MFVRANFVDIYSQGMRDRSMRRGTGLAREIKLTDWSMAGNLSNRASPVSVICTRGGGVLPIMAYTGRLRPKGVPFSGFRYIKG